MKTSREMPDRIAPATGETTPVMLTFLMKSADAKFPEAEPLCHIKVRSTAFS